MPPNQRMLLRAAECIRSQLCRAASTSEEVDFPDAHWNECQALGRQLARAATRGWVNSQAILQDRLERGIASCLERLQQALKQISSFRSKISPPTARAIFNELSALSDDFDTFAVDLASQTVSVNTESVVLEDIDLGPFEIRLYWSRIGQRRCYDVIALEPPARESSDVTHPHVKNTQHCEGDGQIAIERALYSGRLTDFFQIVTRVLNTYNGGSAYVSLSEWEGAACDDCGQFMSEDDQSSCDRCESILCFDCLTPCAECENRCCHACTDPCRFCDSHICPACQRLCDGCDRLSCPNCLSENGLCNECQELEDAKTLNEDEEPPTESEATVTAATGDSDPVAAPDSATF
jgi:hypothetical protein